MSRRLALPLAALLLAAGCSNLPKQGSPDTIAVDSEPAGASVIVMGRVLGTTPLTLPAKAVFPATYPPEQEALYGRITLKKEGCTDHVATVSGNVLGSGLKARLDCTATEPPPPAIATHKASPPPPAPAAAAPIQRLRQLDDIHREGLISDEEHQQLRQRILDTL